MRSSKNRSRSKGNRNRSVGNIVNRVFDSSGPRGQGARHAAADHRQVQPACPRCAAGNDRVAAENFQQHAEHYLRMLGEAQREQDARREQQATSSRAVGRSGPRPAAGAIRNVLARRRRATSRSRSRAPTVGAALRRGGRLGTARTGQHAGRDAGKRAQAAPQPQPTSPQGRGRGRQDRLQPRGRHAAQGRRWRPLARGGGVIPIRAGTAPASISRKRRVNRPCLPCQREFPRQRAEASSGTSSARCRRIDPRGASDGPRYPAQAPSARRAASCAAG
jgi:hypothetical protein